MILRGNTVKINSLTKSIFVTLLLTSSVVVAEEQYPASDFQPTVIYSDASVTSSSSESSKTADSASASAEKTAEVKSEKADSSQTYLLGLGILAVAGAFFLSKKPKCKAKCSSSESKDTHIAASTIAAGNADDGLTGVERYLRTQSASSATGVERYLAQKEAADKEASVTGVERYLRNQG
jgi:hypothetical protein